MNYYPFHIGDYLSATRHLSWDEDAAYRRLLDVYYTTETPLPLDHRAACRLILATTEPQREAVKIVLREFFIEMPEGWINHRADAEISAMKERQKLAREKANKRWHKQNAERGNAADMPQHDGLDATASATASKNDAVAMLPTPTPTPIPIVKNYTRASLATPDGVSESVWADFIAHRKTKKAAVTQTAINGIVREAAKSGLPLQTVLETMCQRGWTGFKADWMAEKRSVHDERARVIKGLTGYDNRNERDPWDNAIDITGSQT